jgi:hypothetical protein
MHIGEKVRARAKELRIGPTELGRLIKTSKQNVFGIFGRKSMDTDLLLRLSKVLEFDFFVYYYSSKNSTTANSPAGYYGKRKKTPLEEESNASFELKELREKYELLKALYEAKTGKKVPGSFS